MRILLAGVISLGIALGAFAQTPRKEIRLRQAVQSFYDAFNAHGFGRAAKYTTQDWNHINPGGGWKSGRAAVLKELKEVRSTFLKGVFDTVEDVEISAVEISGS